MEGYLSLWFHDAVHPPINLHGTNPLAKRHGREGHVENNVRLKVGLGAYLGDPLQGLVGDVVLVELDQLLDKGGAAQLPLRLLPGGLRLPEDHHRPENFGHQLRRVVVGLYLTNVLLVQGLERLGGRKG